MFSVYTHCVSHHNSKIGLVVVKLDNVWKDYNVQFYLTIFTVILLVQQQNTIMKSPAHIKNIWYINYLLFAYYINRKFRIIKTTQLQNHKHLSTKHVQTNYLISLFH